MGEIQSKSFGNITVEQRDDKLYVKNSSLALTYDLTKGSAEIAGTTFTLSGFAAEFSCQDGQKRSTLNQKKIGQLSIEKRSDKFGHGIQVTVQHLNDDDICLKQYFYFYEELSYLLTFLEIGTKRGDEICSNYMAPVAGGELSCGLCGDLRFLSVPFDNDDFVRYQAHPFSQASESYEVTAVYDNDTRNGFIAGSISHELWKTGIQVEQGDAQVLHGMRIFGGITSKLTRDTLPHGFVYGTTVRSPLILLGVFSDYRDGLETFGHANALVTPKLAWDRGIPIGWNSWSAVASEIDYQIYIDASDFVKEELQNQSFSTDGAVYINFDACWTRLSEEELAAASEHVKNNGQIPGIYATPFTFWGNPETDGDKLVQGTNGQYCWRDLLLKDKNGDILPPLDSGYAIDPTHPGNQMRLQREFQKFQDWGFAYVKMDFMSHGTMEGEHFEPSITTGIAAYNYGMEQIRTLLEKKIEAQEFFLSLSIAPLFPANYSHSRRISCDVFGTINWAEYMLNSLTYGWWMNDSVYRFNDPDHIVVYNSFNHREEILFNEGLTRYISSAIAGTMMIDSDDFRMKEARERAKQILTNAEINEVAKAGRTFRPVEGNTGETACDCFVRQDKEAFYLAVFNFDSSKTKEKRLSVKRLGLSEDAKYQLYDLWTKQTSEFQSELVVSLAEAEPKLFRITLL